MDIKKLEEGLVSIIATPFEVDILVAALMSYETSQAEHMGWVQKHGGNKENSLSLNVSHYYLTEGVEIGKHLWLYGSGPMKPSIT